MNVKVLKNIFSLTSAKIFGDIFLFFLFISITRKYGEEGIGIYSFAIAFTGYFAILSDWGLYNYSIKFLAKNTDTFKKNVGEIVALRLTLLIIMSLLLIAVLPFTSFSSNEISIILFIGLFQIGTRFISGFLTIFISQEDMSQASIIEVALKLTNTFISIFLIYLNFSLKSISISLAVTTFIFLIFTYAYLKKKYHTNSLAFSFANFKGILKESSPNALASILFQLSSRIDVVLLGFMLGAASAGMYNIAYRVIFLLQFVPHQIAIALFPSASRNSDLALNVITEQTNYVLRHLALIAIPIAVGIFTIAPDIISIIFGEKFYSSIIVLKILSLLLLLMFFTHYFSMLLMSYNLEITRTKSYGISAIISLVSNVVLIKHFGIIGAAISALIAETSLLLLFIYHIRKFLNFNKLLSRITIALLGSFTFYIIFSKFLDTELWVTIPLSGLIYILFLMSFATIRRNEGTIIFKLFSAIKLKRHVNK